jgi:glycosyltransferase involved in cell wall biosynthesis
MDAYGPAVPELVVTPLGVEPGWLESAPPDENTRREMGLPADYFLFVGTREPRKDLATLLTAYARFRATHRGDVPVLVLVGPAGWGPGQEPAAGVQIRDYAPIDELRAITAGARALVMPSRDEGFGLPALEGLAAGVPVIVSDVPALLEVTGGRAAVFEVGDADGLADELERAATAPVDAAAAADRRAYAADWTWQRCADLTVAAYRIATGT